MLCSSVASAYLAFGMPATQSGTFPSAYSAGIYGPWDARRAVDGGTGTVAFAYNGDGAPPAWWQVDLTEACLVYSATVIAPQSSGNI